MSESNASAISTPRAVSRTHKLTVTAMLSTVCLLYTSSTASAMRRSTCAKMAALTSPPSSAR